MSRLSFICLLLPAILALLVASSFGLGVDEAHYMLYARHLALSYFDHPPLVGWTHWLFNLVLGETLLSARLPAILLGLVAHWQLFAFLRRMGFSESHSRWGLVAGGLCFQFFVLFLFLLPDTLCLVLFWPLLAVAASLAEKPSIKKWLGLGLVLGLLGLAKYTAFFFVVPVAVVLIRRQGFSFLRQPGVYLGALISLLLVSPVLIWNAQQGWASFLYQAGHVATGSEGFSGFLRSWVLQWALYSPFLWGFSIWGFLHLRKRQDARAEFAFWSAATFGAFFLWSAWQQTVLPHWPALFYFLTIPVGIARALETKWRTLAVAMTGLTAACVLAVVVLMSTGLGFRIPNALKEVGGWPQVMREADQRLNSENERLAFLNWTYGSRALYYGRAIENRIVIVDDRQDQFDLWNPEDWTGRDLWVTQFSYDWKDPLSVLACDSLSEKQQSPVFVKGSELYQVIFQRCANARPALKL